MNARNPLPITELRPPCRQHGVRSLAACLGLLLGAVAAEAKEPVAIFHVGNSLTDQAYGMHDIAKARGHETKFGRHMIPGAPLEWLWNHRAEGGHWYKLTAAEEKLLDPNTARRISELIEQGARGDKPFFIACGFRRPHLPWMAPANYFDLYPPDQLPLPVTGNVPRPAGDPGKPAASPDSRRASLRGCFACISFMDRQLGRVLDTLDRLTFGPCLVAGVPLAAEVTPRPNIVIILADEEY